MQEVHSQLCSHKADLQCVTERLKMKYRDTPVPGEVEAQLQEVTQSLQQLEQQVGGRVQCGEVQQVEQVCVRVCASVNRRRLLRQVAQEVERSGPVYSLGAKLSEIQTGLGSVQKRLDERSPTVTQAKVTQKVSEGTSHRPISKLDNDKTEGQTAAWQGGRCVQGWPQGAARRAGSTTTAAAG